LEIVERSAMHNLQSFFRFYITLLTISFFLSFPKLIDGSTSTTTTKVAVNLNDGNSNTKGGKGEECQNENYQSYVPVIDIDLLRSLKNNDNDISDEVKAVAQEINEACEKVGFFIITNHGVDQTTINDAWQITKDYFDQDESIKRAEASMTDDYPYGYSGYGEEILSRGKEFEEGRKFSVKPDLKEMFTLGPYDSASGMPAPRWPSQPQGFKEKELKYYMAMEDLADTLMKGFALALDLPLNFFEDKMKGHCSAMRTLNYPHVNPDLIEEGQLRASVHTDYGILTILRQDAAPGGLQVQNRHTKEWINVPQIANAYVINLGDLMSRWTNDRWTSTPHRVVPPPKDVKGSTRRQSIAFFVNIRSDEEVSVLPSCIEEGKEAKYPPINAMKFLLEKHAASTRGIKI